MAIPTRSTRRAVPELAFGGDLIGREAELAVIAEWLHDPRRRLLTITGEGGVGKTHLAYQAMQLASRQSGAIFASLASVNDHHLVLPAIGQAMGLDDRLGAPVIDLLREVMEDQPATLVLDNLEHLPEAPAIAASLLEELPEVKILATSRLPLSLRAEELLVLAPLSFPAAGDSAPFAGIAASPAVALFVQRVQRVDRSFHLTPDNAPLVGEICRRLEGLPLAIELIASRAGTLSLNEMLARIDDQLGLLRAKKADAPERQWSIEASIDWSVDLLSVPERAGLQRLAVFPGSFRADDAHLVADVDLDHLDVLARHHLIRPLRRAGRADRFTLPAPVKQVCLQALIADDLLSTMRDRHAWVVADIVAKNQAQLGTTMRFAAREALDDRIDDINAALRWTIDRNDLATAIRIATSMRHAWSVVVHSSVGLRWLHEIRVTAERTGYSDRAALVQVMLASGLVAYQAEQYDGSSQDFDRAVRYARLVDDRQILIDALIRSAPTAIERRQFDEAERLIDEAMGLFDEETPAKSVQMASTQRGILAMHRGEHDKALQAFQPGLNRARQLGNPLSLAFHERLVGQALYGLGHFAESREFLLNALATIGDERSTHYYITVLSLARLEIAVGQHQQAAHGLVDYLNGRSARREEKRAREGIFEVARLAHLDGASEYVAKFLGAACNGPTIYLPVGDQLAIEQKLANTAKQVLGQERYDALYRRGQVIALSQSVEEAVTYASELEQRAIGMGFASAMTLTVNLELTSRELQVLQCLVEGKTDREIGDTLFISHATASTHVRNILRKLDAPSRSMAVVIAVRHGIVSLSDSVM